MGIIESLEKRRTHYKIGNELPISRQKVEETIKRVTELIPDSFNMRSQRVVTLFGEEHENLWDEI